VFENNNKFPVVYLDFVNMSSNNLIDVQKSFRKQVLRLIDTLLSQENLDYVLREYINDSLDYDPSVLNSLVEVVAKQYGQKPYIIVDEYDKVVMDSINYPEGESIKKFTMAALSCLLKGSVPFEKAVLTGVTRTTKENLFSGLNNIKVYDVLKTSIYDSDFSLTHEELTELVPECELYSVQEWYNNTRVGKAQLYNVFSVMNYLQNPEDGFVRYWSRSGSDGLLASLLNGQRTKDIAYMLDNTEHKVDSVLDSRLNMEHLRNPANCDDTSFYTLTVQAGYLTFEPSDGCDWYKLYIPNKEAWYVWARLVLDSQYKGADIKLVEIFKQIHDVEAFSEQLTKFASMILSYHDVKEESTEGIYHVFFLGLIHALGYKCTSNKEAGLGRFDILIEAQSFNAVIEFKKFETNSKTTSKSMLENKAIEALNQIDDKEYWNDIKDSPLPLYKIGIACRGKKCLVKTVIHINK
jgi:hypothetical protein